jgi:hypothetical protein
MDHGQLSMVADKFQWVFSEALLNACSTDVTFYRRQRVIARCGTTVTSKAFPNQVTKPHSADVARTMAARLISDMTLKVLGVEQGRAYGEFRHIVLQDGNSFAIHDGLHEVIPGRFKVVTPAVVELHTTMDVLCDAPTTVVLTPETAKEQAFLPEPVSLRDARLLADRGSIDLHSLRRRQAEDGCLLIRAKAALHLQVVEVFREDGKRLYSLRNKRLKTIHPTLPKRPRVALGVQWQVDGHPLCLRLSLSWNPRAKSFCSLLTNLPSTWYLLEVISRAYTWRWPGEFLLQEWQSYANLYACDTVKVAIVEGLMWTAIAAAALKQFVAHMTQRLAEVSLSTRKVALCAVHVFGDLVEALQHGDIAVLYTALEAAITSLACHAQRAHPKRDRHTGRSRLGLEPLFEDEDVIEWAEAA